MMVNKNNTQTHKGTSKSRINPSDSKWSSYHTAGQAD